MITYKTGDIFKSKAQVLTNPVNCVGVMGKGLALAFKNKFPDMFLDYKAKCDRQEVIPGRPYLWENSFVQILNFPTKRHWSQDSLLSDIEDGLKYLAQNYAQMGVSSLALPALGSGFGGLKWADVKNLINKYLGPIVDLDVYVYEPTEAEALGDELDQRSMAKKQEDEGFAAQQQLF